MEVIWTKVGKESFESISMFLAEAYSVKIRDKYIEEVFSTIKLLKGFPEMFPVSSLKKHKKARKGIIHPNFSFYYKISELDIVILLFTDNRSNNKEIEVE